MLALEIATDAITPDDPELLGDLIIAAVSDAIAKVDSEMEGQMGGMGIPGMPGGLPF